MEQFADPPTQKEMQALREGIKHKYRSYHLLDRDRFPEFEYNTSRANYEPLRASFDEEFYGIRGVNRADRSIHVPSTNTLAQLFSDEHYLPGKKILSTCQAYTDVVSGATDTDASHTVNPGVVTVPAKPVTWFLAGAVVLIILFVYTIREFTLKAAPPASGLTLSRPSNGRVVPNELLAGGSVLNARIVWVVVRPKGSDQYFVQPPNTVGDDHKWRGVIYIGSANVANIGAAFQIRAFVNPDVTLIEGDLLHAWPRAELATGIVEVIRGAQKE